MHFNPLFEGMDREKLGIKNFGITSTKLEDVFLKVAGEGDMMKGLHTGVQDISESHQALPVENSSASIGTWESQAKAESGKRVRQAQRDGKAFVFVFLLPIAMIVAGLAFGLVSLLKEIDSLNLTLNLTLPVSDGGKLPFAASTASDAKAGLNRQRSDTGDDKIIKMLECIRLATEV